MALKTDPLKEQAYVAIRQSIINGELDKDIVYSARWFADHLEISRTPVREALLKLEDERLVEIKSNYGVIIKPFTKEDALHVMQVRTAIDGYCSYCLALRHDEPEAKRTIRHMEFIIDSCKINFNREDELQFHIDAIQFCGNAELLDEYQRVRTRMDVYWNEIVTIARKDEVFIEHTKILDCIKSGDAMGAYLAVMEHLQITYERIVESQFFSRFAE